MATQAQGGSATQAHGDATTQAPEQARAEIHHDHRDVTGGWLRPAVFGVNDGLASNFALITGVAGGSAKPGTIALAGLAGLVAGAFSMGTGEYVSVASQSEVALAEIQVEKEEIRRRPEAEQRELAQLFERRGVDRETAAKVAEQLSADPEQAWRIHAREELGIDPDDLPSPLQAAVSSFAAFSVGAFVPLLPFLFGVRGIWLSAVLALVALLTTGALVSRFTSRSWWYSALRQAVLAAAAAAVTYGIGQLVGTSIS